MTDRQEWVRRPDGAMDTVDIPLNWPTSDPDQEDCIVCGEDAPNPTGIIRIPVCLTCRLERLPTGKPLDPDFDWDTRHDHEPTTEGHWR